MKLIKSSLIAGFALFLTTGIAGAVEMDDLAITIRVIETDDVNEVANELSLPVGVSDDLREHDDGEHQGSSDDDRDKTASQDRSGREADEYEAEDHEDTSEYQGEAKEDHDDQVEEHQDATEEEEHDKDHEVTIGDNP